MNADNAALATTEAASVRLEWRQSVAWVTLHNPPRLNAMNRSMWCELQRVFVHLQQSAQARCIVIQGHGGTFCAGGDIAEYPGFRFERAALQQFHEADVWGALSAILDCDVPVLAAIEGVCMGAGVEIASCCDLRLAGASARFGAPIARLGFPMAPREAELVSQALGATAARAMLLAAEVFGAEHLLAQGFLTQVVADDGVQALAQSMAARVAALAPQAARLNKQTLRLLQRGQSVPHAYDYADSAEHREGVAAFLAKRKPDF